MYASQTDPSGSFIGYHRMVLHDAVQHGTWGQLLANGLTAAGTEMKHTFSMKLKPAWNKNRLSYLVIVYKKNTTTNKYEIENVTKEYSTEPNAISDLVAAGINVFPNPASGYINISLPDAGRSNVRLIDHSGKILKTNILRDNRTGIKINLPADVATGIYCLEITCLGMIYFTPVTIVR
jgi:hypothetical protein